MALSMILNRMRNTVVHLMDKESMCGSPMFAQIENRHCHTQQNGQALDKDGQLVVPCEKLPNVSLDIANQPHGGIPFVYSFGDAHQLPPVGMKVC